MVALTNAFAVVIFTITPFIAETSASTLRQKRQLSPLLELEYKLGPIMRYEPSRQVTF